MATESAIAAIAAQLDRVMGALDKQVSLLLQPLDRRRPRLTLRPPRVRQRRHGVTSFIAMQTVLRHDAMLTFAQEHGAL